MADGFELHKNGPYGEIIGPKILIYLPYQKNASVEGCLESKRHDELDTDRKK